MAEAWVLRCEIIVELKAAHPVIVMVDFKDSEHAMSSEIIAAEKPFKSYSWLLRHNVKASNDRYSKDENETI